jgi:hypothetical protein
MFNSKRKSPALSKNNVMGGQFPGVRPNDSPRRGIKLTTQVGKFSSGITFAALRQIDPATQLRFNIMRTRISEKLITFRSPHVAQNLQFMMTSKSPTIVMTDRFRNQRRIKTLLNCSMAPLGSVHGHNSRVHVQSQHSFKHGDKAPESNQLITHRIPKNMWPFPMSMMRNENINRRKTCQRGPRNQPNKSTMSNQLVEICNVDFWLR